MRDELDRSASGADGDSASLRDVERLCLRNLLALADERLFFKDLSSRFLLVSAGWLAAVGRGLSVEEVVGKTDFDFFSLPHATAALEDERWIIGTGESIVTKIERETFTDREDAWVSTSRWPLRDGEGRIVGTFGISRNVDAEMLDPVTGLANRIALMDRLRQALLALERQPGRVALLFLDVDGFKEVNDTWGHRVGDLVLAELGKRLTRISRRFDTVARYGGDEFVLLYTALQENDNLGLICGRVMRALSAPVHCGGQRLPLSASIGAVVCADPRADPHDILEEGDTAMYAAKRDGGGRLVIYDAAVHRRSAIQPPASASPDTVSRVVSGASASIAAVIARMTAVGTGLAPTDGVARFNHLYLEVTQAVDVVTRDRGFEDPDFVAALDATFAGLYFAALDATASGQPLARCWAPLFAARANPHIAPIQFALAGMNAHINHDLPLAVLATCQARGVPVARDSSQYRDFTKVNGLLASVEARVKHEWLTGLVGVADDVLGRIDDVVAMWSIGEARAAAWTNAEMLWALRDQPELTAAFEDALDGTVGFASRGLLVPTLP